MRSLLFLLLLVSIFSCNDSSTVQQELTNARDSFISISNENQILNDSIAGLLTRDSTLSGQLESQTRKTDHFKARYSKTFNLLKQNQKDLKWTKRDLNAAQTNLRGLAYKVGNSILIPKSKIDTLASDSLGVCEIINNHQGDIEKEYWLYQSLGRPGKWLLKINKQ